MAKVKEKKTSLLATDLGLRIVAIIIAVIIWLFLSITEYPTINKTITNVPVVFSMDGTAAAEKGLEPVGYKETTVDVEIKGMNYEIGSYGVNDLVATVNLDSVNKEGTYPLEINVKSAHSSDSVSVVKVSPDTVDINFVHIGSYSFDVTASAPNVSAAQEMTLRSPTVSPSQVTVKGAESELAKIKRVEAVINDNATLSEATTLSTEKIFYYDEDGQRLDGSKFTLVDAKSFDVTFDVYKKKQVNFNVEFTDVPPGFDISSLPYELSESSITVITPKLTDVDSQTITLGSISLGDIDEGKSFSFEVNPKLQSGEINQSGVDTVIMSFDFTKKNYTKQTFTIPAEMLKITNLPAGKSVSIETRQIPSVSLFGPAEAVRDLTISDITAVVDLSDVSASGSIFRKVTVYAQGHSDVWCLGEQEIQLDIEDKISSSGRPDSSSSSSSSSSETDSSKSGD